MPPRQPKTVQDALAALREAMPDTDLASVAPTAPFTSLNQARAAHSGTLPTIEESVATIIAARAAEDPTIAAAHALAAAQASAPAKPKPAPLTQAEIDHQLAAEELAALHAQRDKLEADLDAARRFAESTKLSLAAVEDLWARAEIHTKVEGQRLAQLREDAISSTAAIAGIEERIKEITREMAHRQADDEQKRIREQLAAEWPPLVREMATAVRTLLRLLARQQYVREENSAAWGLVRCDTLSLSDSRGDNTVGWLSQWLLEAERSGYLAQHEPPATPPAPAKADAVSPAVRALIAEVTAAKAKVAALRATSDDAATHTNP